MCLGGRLRFLPYRLPASLSIFIVVVDRHRRVLNSHSCLGFVLVDRHRRVAGSITSPSLAGFALSSLIVSYVFYFFAFLGSVVFSRGSKKVLFWLTVQEQ